jgi:hypothetical protein
MVATPKQPSCTTAWEEKVPNGMSRLDADGLFRQALRQLEVPFLRRWAMWAGVRLAAFFKFDGRKEWWKEAPRTLSIFLGFLPILGPPVVMILISLAVFYILEWIVYLPLHLTHSVRKKLNLPTKKVNRPTLTWKT